MLKRNEIIMMMKDRNIAHVCRETGLERHRIKHALRGKNPSYYTIEALSDYLESQIKTIKGEKE